MTINTVVTEVTFCFCIAKKKKVLNLFFLVSKLTINTFYEQFISQLSLHVLLFTALWT